MVFHANKFDWLAVLILAATLCFCIAVSAGGISAAAIFCVVAIAFLTWITGHAVLDLLRLPLPISAKFPAEILIGVGCTSVVILLLCLLMRISAGISFLITSVLSLFVVGLNSPIRTNSLRI